MFLSKLNLSLFLYKRISVYPLVTFRIFFGILMLISIIRFAANDWINEMYIKPQFYFTYYGFDWVQSLGNWMYLVFVLLGVAALFISLGLFYRISTITFFTLFTYVELIDKTNYLNHYYFVSLISFLLIFLPANRCFSLDLFWKPNLKRDTVPAWSINILKFQLAVVYFFAGVAKLNSDWLFHALPLRMWLPANDHLPIIGSFLNKTWVAYAFSWFGCLYDLSIPFLLLNKKFRPYAYIAVVVFHLMTRVLFPIGMFPYIMIVATLIFFDNDVHKKIITFITKGLGLKKEFSIPLPQGGLPAGKAGDRSLTLHSFSDEAGGQRILITTCLILFIAIQLALPFRYTLYSGNLFWTEQGYRFSWRVMLAEKAGYAIFRIKDPISGKEGEITNSDYLTLNQEKMMSTQPDMILQFAHFIRDKYHKKGIKNPIVTVESYVTLNGRGSRLFIDSSVNLSTIERGWHTKDWILPYEE